MSSPNTRPTLLEHTRENIDVVVFSMFFAYFIINSYDYHEVTRQFPLVFLMLGLVFLIVEFSIDLLPSQYSQTMRRITSGLTEDIDEELEETNDDGEPVQHSIWSPNFVKITALLVLLVGSTFLIGYLPAAMVFIYLTTYTLGSRNFVHATILAVFMLLLIYFVFGHVMNVPIFEGMYDLSEYIEWLP